MYKIFFNWIPLHGNERLIQRETKLKYAALGQAGSYSFSTISLSKKFLTKLKIRFNNSWVGFLL